MAEECLDRPQVAAPTQKVGREAVAQRVRGGAFREAEMAPQLAHAALDEAGIEAPAAGADEERADCGDGVGTGGAVFGDRFADHGQERHQPLLAALAADQQRFGVGGNVALGQAQGLADPQARAVEQQKNGGVPFGDPVRRRQVGNRFRRRPGLGDREWPRHRAPNPRRPDAGQSRTMDQSLAVEAAEESTHRRQGAGGRDPGPAGVRAPG